MHLLPFFRLRTQFVPILRSPTRRASARGVLWGVAGLFLCASAQAQTVSPTQVVRLDSVWVQPERTAAAQVVARNESRLAAEVAGLVQRWGPDVGSTVAQGELLVQIDRRDYQLALERARASQQAAQARFQMAQTQLERAQDLVEQGFFSQEALTQRETELALHQAERTNATSQVRSAQRQLDKTTLRAPFDASVAQRHAQVGETVAVGTVLYVLADIGPPQVQASVSPADVAGLRQATHIDFVPQLGGAPMPLTLRGVTASLQTTSRTHTARLALANNESNTPADDDAMTRMHSVLLAPGSSGTIRWQDATPHIPATLIVKRGTELGVFVQQGNTARFVALPLAQEGRAAPTTLAPTTRIVVRGHAALQDGQSLAAPPTASPQ